MSCSADDDAGTDTTAPADTRADGAEIVTGGASGSSTLGVLSSVGMESLSTTGLRVAALGRAEVDADVAHVVLVPKGAEAALFPSGGDSNDEWDEDAILEALAEIDVSPDDVELTEPSSPLDYSTSAGEVVVRIDSAALPARGEAIEDAVDSVVDVGAYGVRFKVSDCADGLASARDDALERAQRAAATMATAAGVEVGPLRSIASSDDSASFAFGSGISTDPCDLELAQPSIDEYFETGPLSDFEAEPTAEITYALQVTYDVKGVEPPTRWLSAPGTASISAPADIAHVEVLVGSEEELLGLPFGGGGGDRVEEAEVAAALEPLGIAADDVQVRSEANSYPPGQRISVRIDVSDLPDLADDIVDLLEDELKIEGSNGVRFASSTCRELVDDAMAAAVDDANEDLEALAGASGVDIGEVVGAMDPSSGFGGALDPCAESDDEGGGGPSSIEEALLSSFSEVGHQLSAFDDPPVFEAEVGVVLTRAVSES